MKENIKQFINTLIFQNYVKKFVIIILKPLSMCRSYIKILERFTVYSYQLITCTLLHSYYSFFTKDINRKYLCTEALMLTGPLVWNSQVLCICGHAVCCCQNQHNDTSSRGHIWAHKKTKQISNLLVLNDQVASMVLKYFFMYFFSEMC